MGVSGSGKTTVGKALAASLGWRFVDADDYHPAANIAKMRAGIPLTDADRLPWLKTLERLVDDACARGENLVLACSALKHQYRDYLREGSHVRFVYLEGSEALIAERLKARRGHFMDPALLHSQFEALEPPEDALRVDVSPPPEAIAREIRERLNLHAG
jgi:gluconokinase